VTLEFEQNGAVGQNLRLKTGPWRARGPASKMKLDQLESACSPKHRTCSPIFRTDTVADAKVRKIGLTEFPSGISAMSLVEGMR